MNTPKKRSNKRTRTDSLAHLQALLDTNPGHGVEPTPDDRREVVELAKLLRHVTLKAAYVNSAPFTAEDRKRLRELVPAGTYLDLLVSLVLLSNERTRHELAATGYPTKLVINLKTFFKEYQADGEAQS